MPKPPTDVGSVLSKNGTSEPLPFLWGVATSSHQIEGGNRHNDWWRWEEQGNVEGGVRSGRACDHWNRFREDLRLAKEMGANSYRFSIEWSRIEPKEGAWDDSALAWYEELVSECERLGLVPMATLHHFTEPAWFSDHGGWTWEKSPDRFAGYVMRVVKKLGARVPLWCTLNEPMTLVVGQYLGGFMPPASYQPKRVGIASRNLLRAHVRAYEILHAQKTPRSGPWASAPLQVGFAHNMVDVRPYRRAHWIDRLLANRVRSFYNGAWLDAVTGKRQHFGIPFLVPFPKQVWEARRRRTVDFIGVNYYTKAYVCWGPQKEQGQFFRTKWMPVGVLTSKEGDPVSDLGWPIHPEGIGRILRYTQRFRVPMYITENGLADADDSRRGEYLRNHVREMLRARERGADVRGYFHWSLLDNFEWSKGYWPRFGLVAVNYDTMERTPRASAAVFRELSQAATVK